MRVDRSPPATRAIEAVTSESGRAAARSAPTARDAGASQHREEEEASRTRSEPELAEGRGLRLHHGGGPARALRGRRCGPRAGPPPGAWSAPARPGAVGGHGERRRTGGASTPGGTSTSVRAVVVDHRHWSPSSPPIPSSRRRMALRARWPRRRCRRCRVAKSFTGEATSMTGSSPPSAGRAAESAPSSGGQVVGRSGRGVDRRACAAAGRAARRGPRRAAPLAAGAPRPARYRAVPVKEAAAAMVPPWSWMSRRRKSSANLGSPESRVSCMASASDQLPHREGALALEATHRLVDLAGAGLQVVLDRGLDHAARHPVEAEGGHAQRAGHQGQRGGQQAQPERVGGRCASDIGAPARSSST